jgi:hypothetical protein
MADAGGRRLVTDYQLVPGADCATLNQRVGELLLAGWQPWGSPITDGVDGLVFQAMVLWAAEEEPA